MAKGISKFQPDSGSLQSLAERCAVGLCALYTTVRASTGAEPALVYAESIRYIVRMLALLITAQRIPAQRPAFEAATAAVEAIISGLDRPAESTRKLYEQSSAEIHAASGLNLFQASDQVVFDSQAFAITAQALLRPHPDAPIERLFYETMPISWLGSSYQRMLTFRPDEADNQLEPSRSFRKGRGVFFTPHSLVTYIVEGVLTPMIDSRVSLFADTNNGPVRILDPSMGGGDFLTRAIELLAGSDQSNAELRARIAAVCLYGVDVDPGAVEIARFGVWVSASFADGISDALNSHLVCGNALGARHEDEQEYDWIGAFPDAFADGGFDAVIGNPPYIAAKNGLNGMRASGQSDSYLMFLSEIMDNNLVKPGGLFSMVLPDPMLVRENAVAIRRKLVTDWSIVSLLHISEAFPDALVANIVPICRNAPFSEPSFFTTRIERAADRHSFLSRPKKTASELAHPVRLQSILAQERNEFLYLLEQGSFGDIIRRIHGENAALTNYVEPFDPQAPTAAAAAYNP